MPEEVPQSCETVPDGFRVCSTEFVKLSPFKAIVVGFADTIEFVHIAPKLLYVSAQTRLYHHPYSGASRFHSLECT